VDAQTVARNALACLDLTSLNDDDTTSAIDALCDRALGAGDTLGIRPAAVCVFPRFVAQCAARLQGSGVRLAAVANFPDGDGAVEAVLDEADASLRHGANEIDVVLPFQRYLAGTPDATVVKAVGERCHEHGALLKVILETGALTNTELIKAAAFDAVAAGADFLKTSTGKREPGATVEAARTLLEVIVETAEAGGRSVGLKVSGGVRTVEDAERYIALAREHLGEARPDNFRIGASGLLNDIGRVLTGASNGHHDKSGY